MLNARISGLLASVLSGFEYNFRNVSQRRAPLKNVEKFQTVFYLNFFSFPLEWVGVGAGGSLTARSLQNTRGGSV